MYVFTHNIPTKVSALAGHGPYGKRNSQSGLNNALKFNLHWISLVTVTPPLKLGGFNRVTPNCTLSLTPEYT